MRIFFKRYAKDKEGATAVEFALILPLFLTLTFGIIEFGLILHVSSVLQNATYEAGRFGVTGHNYKELQAEDENLTREEFINRHIRRQMGPWIQSDGQISINTSSIELDGDPSYSLTSSGFGGHGGSDSIIIYNVQYSWNVLTPFLAPVLGGGDGEFPINAIVVTKNEEF